MPKLTAARSSVATMSWAPNDFLDSCCLVHRGPLLCTAEAFGQAQSSCGSDVLIAAEEIG